MKFFVRDLLKHERLTHSLAIYNGFILLQLLYVLLSCQQHRLRKLPDYNIRVEYYINRLRQTESDMIRTCNVTVSGAIDYGFGLREYIISELYILRQA